MPDKHRQAGAILPCPTYGNPLSAKLPDYIGTAEAAEILGITTRTVRRSSAYINPRASEVAYLQTQRARLSSPDDWARQLPTQPLGLVVVNSCRGKRTASTLTTQ